MQAVQKGTLKDINVEFSSGSACCVVMASKGYPQKYESGFELKIDPSVADSVFVAGAKLEDFVLKTAGGRVLGVTATANTLEEAIKNAYEKTEKVTFANAYFRKDIGAKALMAKKG